MCPHICVCVCVCVHVCTRVRACMRACVCACVCMLVCVLLLKSTQTDFCLWPQHNICTVVYNYTSLMVILFFTVLCKIKHYNKLMTLKNLPDLSQSTSPWGKKISRDKSSVERTTWWNAVEEIKKKEEKVLFILVAPTSLNRLLTSRTWGALCDLSGFIHAWLNSSLQHPPTQSSSAIVHPESLHNCIYYTHTSGGEFITNSKNRYVTRTDHGQCVSLKASIFQVW